MFYPRSPPPPPPPPPLHPVRTFGLPDSPGAKSPSGLLGILYLCFFLFVLQFEEILRDHRSGANGRGLGGNSSGGLLEILRPNPANHPEEYQGVKVAIANRLTAHSCIRDSLVFVSKPENLYIRRARGSVRWPKFGNQQTETYHASPYSSTRLC